MELIDKSAIVLEIEKLKGLLLKGACASQISMQANCKEEAYNEILSFLNTLEVKEVKTFVIPKYSYFEHIYHCGSEPMWKIGDVLAVYELYSNSEGEYVYGKITDVKMDEDKDWCYTFENGEVLYENMLISEEAYKKN